MTTTAKEIQSLILKETGLKTSVKKGTGSMKGYVTIWPKFQNGVYPNIPFEFVQKLKGILSDYNYENKPLFCSTSEVSVYLISDDRINFKNERKPKQEEGIYSPWGSKNSQIRLNKAASRYARNSRLGKTDVRYW